MEWPEYAIKPSSYVSGLCYSVLRLEPWTTCGLGCIYCYARWYRGPHNRPRLKPWWPRLWRRLARLASRLEPRPWFRMSTLSEPFQGAAPHPVVLNALRVALQNGVPLVVNTRSDAVARPEVLHLLSSMAERGLVVVQLSLSVPGAEQLLEPLAPPTWRRLEAVEALAAHEVPVVARLQPLIPGLEERQLEVAGEALSRGARGLVAESLRETREGLEMLYRLLGMKPPRGWERYETGTDPGREGLLRPPAEWRAAVHHALRAIAARYGVAYASCKEGWLRALAWPQWRPGRDCCHAATLLRHPIMLRPTLHEYAYLAERLGRPPAWDEFLEHCRGELSDLGYVCSGSGLEELPRWLRRPLVLHERMLRRIVERKGPTVVARLLGLDAPWQLV